MLRIPNLQSAPGIVTGTILTVSLLAGCSQTRVVEREHYAKNAGPVAVVFFVDGLAREPFERMAAEGRLPNIRAKFIDGGVRVNKAVTAIPSITYPMNVSLLTGLFPGHHGVVGNKWFDRPTSFIRDYSYLATYQAVNGDFSAPTLFELLEDRLTITVQANTFRGSTAVVNNPIDTGLDWTSGRFTAVDARVGESFDRVAGIARSRGEWPVVYWNYLPAVDEIGHRFGSNSPEYAHALAVMDEAVGRVIAGVSMAAPTDEVYYALITDHGHQPCRPDHTLDLSAWVERTQDLAVMSGDLQSGFAGLRALNLRRYGAVVINGAFRRGAIFLRGPDGWSSDADPGQIRRLVEGDGRQTGLAAEPAIAVACYREGPGGVRLVSRLGRGLIERRVRPGGKEYRLLDQGEGDVLGYLAQPDLAAFVRSGWHDSRSWLAATGGGEFPDFVPQIVELFDSPRAGDVVAFAAADWTFDPQLPGGHGSCVAADMRIPFFFAGPDLPPGSSIPCGRLVDLMPTILDLVGESQRLADRPVDGVSLAAELRAAQSAAIAGRATTGPRASTAATRPGSSRR